METFFNVAELEDLEESEFSGSEIESEDLLESISDEDFVEIDVDELSFENVNVDYFSIGYVDPSDFE